MEMPQSLVVNLEGRTQQFVNNKFQFRFQINSLVSLYPFLGQGPGPASGAGVPGQNREGLGRSLAEVTV